MLPFLDPDCLNNMDITPSNPKLSPQRSLSPILILSPSSLSHRPQILVSLLSSLPSTQPHDLHMLDRIALNFANLPVNHYSEAILALPTTEESSGEFEEDYNQLVTAFSKILNTMRAGGRVRIGSPTAQVTKEAILAGFLVETDSNQVHTHLLLTIDDSSETSVNGSSTPPFETNTHRTKNQKTSRLFNFRYFRYNRRVVTS
jgi:Fe-S cluster assembly protein DRE2 N-terminus